MVVERLLLLLMVFPSFSIVHICDLVEAFAHFFKQKMFLVS